MKIKSIFALATAALAWTGCSTDLEPEKLPTNSASGVTVEMQDAELVFPEDQMSSNTYYDIPIVVTGETNGAVEVTVELGEIGETPAKAGENYIVTSKKVIIPAGTNVGNIQFYPKGDEEENPDRQFTVTIVSAAGATIGAQSSTLVTLLDNELMVKNAYRDIQGVWTVSANSVFDGPVTYQLIIQGYPEGDANYLKVVNLVGIGGTPDFVVPATISCNPVNGETNLSIKCNDGVLGTAMAGSAGLVDIRLLYVEGESLYLNGNVTAVGNPDLTQIVFNDALYGGAFKAGSSSGSDFLGGWFFDQDVVMTKM